MFANPGPDLTVRWEELKVGDRTVCQVEVASPYLQSIKSARCSSGPELGQFLSSRYNRMLSAIRSRGVLRPNSSIGDDQKGSIDQLRGLGRELYEHWTPAVFREALWKLIDRERTDSNFHLSTIQIYTNNPTLPWEILVPARGDGSDVRGFLGAQFEVARWHISNGVRDLPPLNLLLRSLITIAPHYEGGELLAHQAEEVESVRVLPGYQAVPGDRRGLFSVLDRPQEGIVHFAGHGLARKGRDGTYEFGIRLEDAALDPTSWRAHPGNSDTVHPLYFFNACDSAQEFQIASFIDGWAGAILESGASGFIGGLWPLSDQGAALFSREFYRGLAADLRDSRPASVSRLVQLARKRFLDTGDPTFMAYVFYGDTRLRILSASR